MANEFTLYEDKDRGIKTVGWFLPDGRIHVQVRQYIPDSFFEALKVMRERFALRKKGTQSHWRPSMVLPSALAENLFKDGDGKQLALNDPERDKRWKRLENDIDYRNLRASEAKS